MYSVSKEKQSPCKLLLLYVLISIPSPPIPASLSCQYNQVFSIMCCVHSAQIDLTLYDPKASATGEMVTCDQDFCTAAAQGPIPGCTSNLNCVYSTVYGDGSSSTGYFVRDVVQYNQVSGNLQTTPANGSVVFG